jgi:hypothetical protein
MSDLTIVNCQVLLGWIESNARHISEAKSLNFGSFQVTLYSGKGTVGIHIIRFINQNFKAEERM